MEIITKNKIYFQKQDIKHLQSLEGDLFLTNDIALPIYHIMNTTTVTPQNRKEYMSINGLFDFNNMDEYIFAPLYNEVKWLSDDQLDKLIELAIKIKNKKVKDYNRYYAFNETEYHYMKTERKKAEYRLQCLKEYKELRDKNIQFSLPNELTEGEIPVYIPEDEKVIKKLLKK